MPRRKNPRYRGGSSKKFGVSRKIRRAAKSGGGAKQRYYAARSYARAYPEAGRPAAFSRNPLIPAKLKRMPNGSYKIFISPGAMAKLRLNPAGRIKAGYYVITTSDGHSVSQLFKTKAAAVRMAKRYNRSEGWGKYQVRRLGGEVVFAE